MTKIEPKNERSKGTERSDEPVDLRVMKALGHPLRQRILQALNRDAVEPRVASPNEIAIELGESLSKVSYHVKILVQCEAIELVRTAPVRGAVEHFYRATMNTRLEEKEWGALPDSIKGDLITQHLSQTWEHISAAVAVGGFNDPKSTLVWDLLDLDDQAFAELSEGLTALSERASAMKIEAAERLEKLDPEEREKRTRRVAMDLLLYHRG